MTETDNPFKKRIIYDSPAINKYLDQMENMRKNTYIAARAKLSLLPEFANKNYNTTIDELITAMKAGKYDRYDVLAAYNKFLKKEKKKTAQAIRRRVTGAREFFEFHSVEFSDRQLRLKVKLERPIKRIKTATDKEEIISIMQTTQDPFLLLAELWHAATGRRPEEIFSLRHCDLDFKRKIFKIRGEFTKMGIEHERPMTTELASRTEQFLKWKHRHRRIVVHYKDGTHEAVEFDPVLRPADLLFAPYYRDKTHVIPNVESVYDTYQTKLARLLDSIGKGERTNLDNRRSPRKFTFYRLRDHVKTTISDLGYGDFGEWYIGHQHSTYYNQTSKKRQELFAKIEPYITYLDVGALEAKGADVAAKLQATDDRLGAVMAELNKERMERERLYALLYEQGILKQVD